MRKIIVAIMISGFIFVLAGCGETGKALTPDMNSGTQQIVDPADADDSSKQADQSSTANTGKNETQNNANQQDNTQPVDTYTDEGDSNKTDGKTDDGNKSNTVIIAKSDNIIASEDKAAMLKELDSQLDALFSSMNEMEDLQDSDLE